MAEELSNQHTYTVLDAKNGEKTLKAITQDGQALFFHSRYNPLREATTRVAALSNPHADLIVLCGLGLGYDLIALRRQLQSGQRVIVVEKSRDILGMCEKVQGADFLDGVTLLVDQPVAAVRQCIDDCGSGSVCVLVHPSAQQLSPAYYDAISCVQKSRSVQSVTGIVLVGKGIVAPFINQDIVTALRDLGVTVHCFPLSLANEEKLLSDAEALKPDFVFALDYNGLEFPWVKKLACRKIAWFVDNPFYYINECDPEMQLYCWDRTYLDDLTAFGFPHVSHLPLATNPAIFKPMDVSEAMRNQYGCDVSFVGTVAKEAGYGRDAFLRDTGDESMHAAFDRLVGLKSRTVLSPHGSRFHDVVKHQYATLDPLTRLVIERQVDQEVGTALRKEVIGVMGKYDARLFGGDGLSLLTTEKCRYGGPIDYHAAVPFLFNASKINMNVTRPQLRTTVNQRVFDVAATHSFFLTDYREDLATLFPFDLRDVVYTSLSDLDEKITYFLAHPDARTAIAARTYRHVATHHTYHVRMREVLAAVHSSACA